MPENIFMSKSPLITLLFSGEYNTVKGVLPLYLQKRYYKILQSSLASIKIVTQSLLEYLEKCEKNRFHKYSLSDFASYTDIGAYNTIWKGIIKTASKRACICERQFLVKREIPSRVKPYVKRIKQLERKLLTSDDSIFYTFIIAKIRN
jgi:S-adenosylmethionine:diacylglycerol 3-amino-3-carboxypropyl transferase